MASISDVYTKLAKLVEQAVYPNGLTNPSIIGVNVEIVSGYPLKEDLDIKMEAAVPMISIFNPRGMDKDDTRFFKVPEVVNVEDSSVQYVINGDSITIDSPTPTAGQVVMILVNKDTYAYIIQGGDTENIIASQVGALIPSSIVVDNTITIPNAYYIEGRLSVKATVIEEIKRQIKDFSITIWSPNVEYRNQLGDAIDIYLYQQTRIYFDDYTSGILRYSHLYEEDYQQKHRIYRRDLCYNIEYPTVLTYTQNTVTYPYTILTSC